MYNRFNVFQRRAYAHVRTHVLINKKEKENEGKNRNTRTNYFLLPVAVAAFGSNMIKVV
jgi:hypothetical protein